MNKIIGAIVQARMTSTRLPGKVLMDLDGKPALQRVVERLQQSKNINKIVVATSTNKEDDPIVELCGNIGCFVSRGSENDVLTRVLEAAKKNKIDVIVEITADCPLIDPQLIDNLINDIKEIYDGFIYGNIIGERTFPRGCDIRIFTTETLARINRECDNPIDRQHVSTYAYLHPEGKLNYNQVNILAPKHLNRPELEFTLDTQEDYELLNWIFTAGREYKLNLSCSEVINLIDTYPKKYKKVAEIKRKDYFQELQNFYDSKELKQDDTKKVQNSNRRSRKTGSLG